MSATLPQVFISYSHDSEKHKDWVRQLAERLRNDGVDVVLDQWEIGPGDDVTAFMERGLASCHRVLIISTKDYIKKANTLKGGVGYERMIITAEVARNLETRKFIPVLRDVRPGMLPKFLGARLYIDFRIGEINDAQYDVLLRELLGVPKHVKPPVGRSPFGGEKSLPLGGDQVPSTEGTESVSRKIGLGSRGGAMEAEQKWEYHWHRAVHEYCGFKLHLILLRFTQESIVFKDSVLDDLRLSGISDYMAFHLYSHWDVLIRAWADENSIATLKQKFSLNRDLHHEKPPEYLVVQDLTHFTNGPTYGKPDEITRILENTPLEHLSDVQERGEQSEHFRPLKDAGAILEDTIRFDPDRIQFYITIRSTHPLEPVTRERIKKLTSKYEGIRNRSLYMTPGSSIQAVVKGQVDKYYDIYDFLNGIAHELRLAEVTETMLVASPVKYASTRIDFNRAEGHVLTRALQRELPEIDSNATMTLAEKLKLKGLYAEIWKKRREDNSGVLCGLIRAKVNSSAEEVGRLLSSIFPPFEDRLRQRLTGVIVYGYGVDWQKTLDELKAKEGVETNKTINKLSLGDLCKIYKRIVLEKRIVDISPLSEEEFRDVMDAAANKRNDFAHREADLRRWDELFSFCSRFIPIRSRLMSYLENLSTKQ